MRNRLAELVSIDSGSYDDAGLDRHAAVLEAMFAELDFIIERRAIRAASDLIVCRRGFGGSGRLLILGHLDTVWPAGTVRDWPFAADGDIVSGPGVGDMKGGLVQAHAAIGLLLELGLPGPSEIVVMLVPDEELGSPNSRAHVEREAGTADWVLVMEPARPDGSVVIGRGAVGALVVTAEGRSAHVLNRQDGASAIASLAARVGRLEALTQGDVSVSVGIFRGGEARQVVARGCEMHVDLRAPDDASAAMLLARVRDILRPAQDEHVSIHVAGGISRPAFPVDASAALQARARAIAASLDIPYGGLVTRGGSDGSFAAAIGRPTLDGLGPVCFDTCSRRERISWPSLVQRTMLMTRLIAELSASHDVGGAVPDFAETQRWA